MDLDQEMAEAVLDGLLFSADLDRAADYLIEICARVCPWCPDKIKFDVFRVYHGTSIDVQVRSTCGHIGAQATVIRDGVVAETLAIRSISSGALVVRARTRDQGVVVVGGA